MFISQEPTSPEIIQAASEADQAKTKSRKKRTPIANTDTDDGKTDGDTQRELPEASQEETQISDPDSVPMEFNSQSLFQARMISQRKKGDYCLHVSDSQTAEGTHESGQCPTLTCMHPEDSETNANSTAIVSDDSFEALTSIDECMREDTQYSTTKDSLMEEEYSQPLLVTSRSLWKPPSTPIQEDSLANQSAISQSATDISSETQCSAGFDDSFEALTSAAECVREDTQHSTTTNMTDSWMEEEYSQPLLVTSRSLWSNMKPPSTPIQEDSLASQSAISQSATDICSETQYSAGFDDSFEALTSVAECVQEDTQHSANLADSQMEEDYSQPLLVTSRSPWSNMKPPSTPIQEDSLASQSATSQSASGVSETQCSAGFDDLETVEVEDEFNSVLSPPLGCGDTARDDAVEDTTDCYSEFDELEHISVYNSITDGSFTDSEMDLSGFSVDSKENNKSLLSDKAAVVPHVDPEVESTDVTMVSGRHDVESCASDSEWNDVALGPIESTPVCQIGPLTPLSTYPSDSFDGLEDVTESSTEGALAVEHHLPGVYTTEDHSDNLHDSLGSSDLEWEEDTPSIALLPQKVYGTKTTSVQEDTSWPVHGLELQAPRVPDVMNQSLTCDITENDFHWD